MFFTMLRSQDPIMTGLARITGQDILLTGLQDFEVLSASNLCFLTVLRSCDPIYDLQSLVEFCAYEIM